MTSLHAEWGGGTVDVDMGWGHVHNLGEARGHVPR